MNGLHGPVAACNWRQRYACRRCAICAFIAFCSFSKARTSIYRTRSREMPYCCDSCPSVVGLSVRRRSITMCRSRSFSVLSALDSSGRRWSSPGSRFAHQSACHSPSLSCRTMASGRLELHELAVHVVVEPLPARRIRSIRIRRPDPAEDLGARPLRGRRRRGQRKQWAARKRRRCIGWPFAACCCCHDVGRVTMTRDAARHHRSRKPPVVLPQRVRKALVREFAAA